MELNLTKKSLFIYKAILNEVFNERQERMDFKGTDAENYGANTDDAEALDGAADLDNEEVLVEGNYSNLEPLRLKYKPPQPRTITEDDLKG
jgi:hypothetical protein